MIEKRLAKDKIQLLKQALTAASSSLKLANQLLNDVERMGGTGELPGLVGRYDGRFMTTEAGKKYPVPDNYAAKTKLVYGDKLKMIEGPQGRQFKLVEKLPRVEEKAQLVVKDGQFEALAKSGSYKLIQSAVKYWGGEEGDKTKILLPEGKKNIPFACLLEIGGKEPGGREPRIEEEKPTKRTAVRGKKEKVETEEKKSVVTKRTSAKKEKPSGAKSRSRPRADAPSGKGTKTADKLAAKKTLSGEKETPAEKEVGPLGEEELR